MATEDSDWEEKGDGGGEKVEPRFPFHLAKNQHMVAASILTALSCDPTNLEIRKDFCRAQLEKLPASIKGSLALTSLKPKQMKQALIDGVAQTQGSDPFQLDDDGARAFLRDAILNGPVSCTLPELQVLYNKIPSGTKAQFPSVTSKSLGELFTGDKTLPLTLAKFYFYFLFYMQDCEPIVTATSIPKPVSSPLAKQKEEARKAALDDAAKDLVNARLDFSSGSASADKETRSASPGAVAEQQDLMAELARMREELRHAGELAKKNDRIIKEHQKALDARSTVGGAHKSPFLDILGKAHLRDGNIDDEESEGSEAGYDYAGFGGTKSGQYGGDYDEPRHLSRFQRMTMLENERQTRTRQSGSPTNVAISGIQKAALTTFFPGKTIPEMCADVWSSSSFGTKPIPLVVDIERMLCGYGLPLRLGERYFAIGNTLSGNDSERVIAMVAISIDESGNESYVNVAELPESREVNKVLWPKDFREFRFFEGMVLYYMSQLGQKNHSAHANFISWTTVAHAHWERLNIVQPYTAGQCHVSAFAAYFLYYLTMVNHVCVGEDFDAFSTKDDLVWRTVERSHLLLGTNARGKITRQLEARGALLVLGFSCVSKGHLGYTPDFCWKCNQGKLGLLAETKDTLSGETTSTRKMTTAVKEECKTRALELYVKDEKPATVPTVAQFFSEPQYNAKSGKYMKRAKDEKGVTTSTKKASATSDTAASKEKVSIDRFFELLDEAQHLIKTPYNRSLSST